MSSHSDWTFPKGNGDPIFSLSSSSSFEYAQAIVPWIEFHRPRFYSLSWTNANSNDSCPATTQHSVDFDGTGIVSSKSHDNECLRPCLSLFIYINRRRTGKTQGWPTLEITFVPPRWQLLSRSCFHDIILPFLVWFDFDALSASIWPFSSFTNSGFQAFSVWSHLKPPYETYLRMYADKRETEVMDHRDMFSRKWRYTIYLKENLSFDILYHDSPMNYSIITSQQGNTCHM